MGEQKAKGKVKRDGSKEMSRKGLESQDRVWELP